MAERVCTLPGCGKPHRAKGLCSTHYNQRQPNRHVATWTKCTVCGAPIRRLCTVNRRPACSIECRRVIQFGETAPQRAGYDWTTDAVVRAERAGARVIERFDRLQVFERDGWSCYLCGRRTDPDVSPFDPISPTVDHVVPLSRGGDHALANVRTACLSCNSSKQDRAA